MKRIGLYCGSFDPFHMGHQNIVDKSLRMFDEVIIGVGINPDKVDSNTMYHRQEKLQELLPCVTVIAYQGLTIDLIKRIEEDYVNQVSVTLIRGLRDGFDLDYELKSLRFNQDLMPDINVVMIICDREYSHLSSSAIRSLEKISKGLGDKYLV